MKTVVVDLDGVLAQYDHWRGIEHIGEPIPGAVEFTKALKAFPCRVLIYTTRTNADPAIQGHSESVEMLVQRVRQWLDVNGFAYDDIYAGQGKPLAAAYIDDRAVPCQPQSFGHMEYAIVLEVAEDLIRESK